MTILKILLWIYLSYILLRVAWIFRDDSWKKDLENKTERTVYLIVTFILLLLWPVMLVIGLLPSGKKS